MLFSLFLMALFLSPFTFIVGLLIWLFNIGNKKDNQVKANNKKTGMIMMLASLVAFAVGWGICFGAIK